MKNKKEVDVNSVIGLIIGLYLKDTIEDCTLKVIDEQFENNKLKRENMKLREELKALRK